MRRSPALFSDDRGQAIVIIAGAIGAMLFAVALAVNIALFFIAKRDAQNVADAAAMAAAVSVSQGDSDALAEQAGVTAAGQNGYTSGATITVTVDVPAPAPWGAGYAQATVTKRVNALLLSDWGFRDVTAHAVARAEAPIAGNGIFAIGEGCVPADAPYLGLSNGGWIDLWGGDAQVNSSCTRTPPPAKYAANNGGGIVRHCGGVAPTPYPTPPAAPPSCPSPSPSDHINVVGDANGSWPPTLRTGQSPVPDPLLNKPDPPQVGGGNWCRQQSGPPYCTDVNANLCPPGGGAVTLKPGRYSTMISGNQCDFTLESGIYVFAGPTAGISSPRSIANLPGGGVLLFFTYQTWPVQPATAQSNCAQLSMSGNSNNAWDLSAETSGTWKHMLVWYDQARITTGSDAGKLICGRTLGNEALVLTGNSTLNARTSGIIYAPNARVTLNGNAFVYLSQIAAYTIDVGNATAVLDVPTASQLPGSPPRLVE